LMVTQVRPVESVAAAVAAAVTVATHPERQRGPAEQRAGHRRQNNHSLHGFFLNKGTLFSRRRRASAAIIPKLIPWLQSRQATRTARSFILKRNIHPKWMRHLGVFKSDRQSAARARCVRPLLNASMLIQY